MGIKRLSGGMGLLWVGPRACALIARALRELELVAVEDEVDIPLVESLATAFGLLAKVLRFQIDGG